MKHKFPPSYAETTTTTIPHPTQTAARKDWTYFIYRIAMADLLWLLLDACVIVARHTNHVENLAKMIQTTFRAAKRLAARRKKRTEEKLVVEQAACQDHPKSEQMACQDKAQK